MITPDIPQLRKKLYIYYRKSGLNFSSLFSTISKSTNIGTGTIIQSGVNISAESIIGKILKLNTKCNIMYDSNIVDYTTIANNSVIIGKVNIGDLCYIGSNTTKLPNVSICDNVIIGVVTVVTKNIKLAGTVAGVPAKLLKNIVK